MPCLNVMKIRQQVLLWLLLLLSGIWASLEPGFLDFDNLPDTNFTCVGKVIGGYYADLETNCQMFHVCTIGQLDEPMDIRFLCLNGTVFDQETRVCERIDEVDCSNSEKFYSLNLELYGNTQAPISEESAETESPIFVKPSTTTTTTTTTTPRPTTTTRFTYFHSPHHHQQLTTERNNHHQQQHQQQQQQQHQHQQQQHQHQQQQQSQQHQQQQQQHQYHHQRQKPQQPQQIHHQQQQQSSYNNPDIRFNPEEINISLNPGAPPNIRTKPISFQQQIYSDDTDNNNNKQVIVTHSVFNNNNNKPRTVLTTQKVPHKQQVVSFGHSQQQSKTPHSNFNVNYNTQQIVKQNYNPDEPPRFNFNYHLRAPPSYNYHGYSSTTHRNEYLPTTRRSFILSRDATTLRNHYNVPIKSPARQFNFEEEKQTERPEEQEQFESLQLPVPLIPTLSPISFSSPAPFSLSRHTETKRYTHEHSAPPRIIISASASVSDDSGRRLNYSLGTIGAAHLLEQPPSSYDEYKDSDVRLDPFYHDVQKVNKESKRRKKRSASPQEKLNPMDVIKSEQEAIDVLKFLFDWYKRHEKTAPAIQSTAGIPLSTDLITLINDELAVATKDNSEIYAETEDTAEKPQKEPGTETTIPTVDEKQDYDEAFISSQSQDKYVEHTKEYDDKLTNTKLIEAPGNNNQFHESSKNPHLNKSLHHLEETNHELINVEPINNADNVNNKNVQDQVMEKRVDIPKEVKQTNVKPIDTGQFNLVQDSKEYDTEKRLQLTEEIEPPKEQAKIIHNTEQPKEYLKENTYVDDKGKGLELLQDQYIKAAKEQQKIKYEYEQEKESLKETNSASKDTSSDYNKQEYDDYIKHVEKGLELIQDVKPLKEQEIIKHDTEQPSAFPKEANKDKSNVYNTKEYDYVNDNYEPLTYNVSPPKPKQRTVNRGRGRGNKKFTPIEDYLKSSTTEKYEYLKSLEDKQVELPKEQTIEKALKTTYKQEQAERRPNYTQEHLKPTHNINDKFIPNYAFPEYVDDNYEAILNNRPSSENRATEESKTDSYKSSSSLPAITLTESSLVSNTDVNEIPQTNQENSNNTLRNLFREYYTYLDEIDTPGITDKNLDTEKNNTVNSETTEPLTLYTSYISSSEKVLETTSTKEKDYTVDPVFTSPENSDPLTSNYANKHFAPIEVQPLEETTILNQPEGEIIFTTPIEVINDTEKLIPEIKDNKRIIDYSVPTITETIPTTPSMQTENNLKLQYIPDTTTTSVDKETLMATVESKTESQQPPDLIEITTMNPSTKDTGNTDYKPETTEYTTELTKQTTVIDNPSTTIIKDTTNNIVETTLVKEVKSSTEEMVSLLTLIETTTKSMLDTNSVNLYQLTKPIETNRTTDVVNIKDILTSIPVSLTSPKTTQSIDYKTDIVTEQRGEVHHKRGRGRSRNHYQRTTKAPRTRYSSRHRFSTENFSTKSSINVEDNKSETPSDKPKDVESTAQTDTRKFEQKQVVTDAVLEKSLVPTPESETEKSKHISTTPMSQMPYKVHLRKQKVRNFVFNCFGKPINKFYSDPRDCRLFHYCTQGYTKSQLLDMKFVCDFGTYFDDEKLICTKELPKRCEDGF